MPADRDLDCVVVNLMSEAARDATERQWRRLVQESAPERRGAVRFTTGADPRAATGDVRARSGYHPLAEVLSSQADLAVITGAEPTCRDVADEPSWPVMIDTVDWATEHCRVLVVSCQAAHAVLRHRHALGRRRLPEKRTGVFRQDVDLGHPLCRNFPADVEMPHSRLNDIEGNALRRHGWDILIGSGIGWAVAARRIGICQVLLFQSHPEYDADSLLKEFRRDLHRYGRSEAPFPAVPTGYFSIACEQAIENARARPAAELLDHHELELESRYGPGTPPWTRVGAGLVANALAVSETGRLRPSA